MSTTKHVILGVMAGAAAGAILGVLFAPARGSKTRKKIATKSREYKDAVAGQINDLVEKVSETVTHAKDGARQLVETTRSAASDMTNGDTGKVRKG